MLRLGSLVVTALLAVVVTGARVDAAVEVDAALPEYKATSGVSGNCSSIGSDTLNNLMTLWAEKFKSFYPNVNIQIEGKGSSTAPPALIEGTAQLGPMSRHMKSKEKDDFEKKFGYKPTEIRVAVDALAVFVNKDNPVKGLSLPQVDAIFSKTRKGGAAADLTTWGQVGLEGDWKDRPISLYGRNSASGTYGFFKDEALFKGDFKDEVKEQPGSAAVVQGVTVDKFGAGYSGIGYMTAGVRAVPLSKKDGEEFVEATAENCYAGKFPLARFLLIYINKAPGKPLDPLTKEYLKLVLGKEGQEVVVKDGYFPIPAKIAEAELKKLED
ncbi:MAG: hypothetical protein AMXMBFR7_24380 [Planctomycetota bacterium]